MAWTEAEQSTFLACMESYWPSSRRDRGPIFEVYLEAAQRYPAKVAMDALKAVKFSEERSWLPTVARLLDACNQHGGTGAGRNTRKATLLARMEELSTRGARWTSPKGRDCLITKDGLVFERPDGETACLPWGDMETQDMERILQGNERDVRIPPDADVPSSLEALARDVLERWRKRGWGRAVCS